MLEQFLQTHKHTLQSSKMSVTIQKMVRSDLGSAGVASIDTETGYDKAVIINSVLWFSELVVMSVKPDEFIVNKILLKDIDPILLQN